MLPVKTEQKPVIIGQKQPPDLFLTNFPEIHNNRPRPTTNNLLTPTKVPNIQPPPAPTQFNSMYSASTKAPKFPEHNPSCLAKKLDLSDSSSIQNLSILTEPHHSDGVMNPSKFFFNFFGEDWIQNKLTIFISKPYKIIIWGNPHHFDVDWVGVDKGGFW